LADACSAISLVFWVTEPGFRPAPVRLPPRLILISVD
jgi:hypothetical protein